MFRIELSTRIRAPIERCFDLARSIDLHTASTEDTNERALDGVVTGLIGMGESVTFAARHFGIWVTHTSLITAFDRPRHFRDEMTRGFFRSFVHDHVFVEDGDATVMRDTLVFSSKFGPLSWLLSRYVLAPHLTKLLKARNGFIRQVGESDDWTIFVNHDRELPNDSDQEMMAAARRCMYKYRHALRKMADENYDWPQQ
jgi:ligand-binding SRPBCC domain-containing protein